MTSSKDEIIRQRATDLFQRYREDWVFFAEDVFGVFLDDEQKEILRAVQHYSRVSVRSGTARGKDFVSAVAAMCFMYLTPTWNEDGTMAGNTKVALTAPTDRQVENIMIPEIARLYERAKMRGKRLPGSLLSRGIRTNSKEWFLTGFKADDNNTEAWTGFHAVNTMFVVTEASGISEATFNAIEGNLQGNSRILIVFNPNVTSGYAAKTHTQSRWHSFKLNGLNAPNVKEKRTIIQGQVDYNWVLDKVENWCQPIRKEEAKESENDFTFNGAWYRPNDLFRIKILGEFPKTGDDVLIPAKWIELAKERWNEYHMMHHNDIIIGADVAGMGRDCSVDCYRQGAYVEKFEKHNSAGKADHMAVAGKHIQYLKTHSNCVVSIDTIGEGAGVYSREIEESETCMEMQPWQIVSCKFSNASRDSSGAELTDVTGEYQFQNMKAYLYWAVRDWLNPDNNTGAMLPPGGTLAEEATTIRWRFQSTGKILIEPKEDTKERLGHSPDEFDALANTFHPAAVRGVMEAYSNEKDLTDSELEDVFF